MLRTLRASRAHVASAGGRAPCSERGVRIELGANGVERRDRVFQAGAGGERCC
jgi:hypothetical protein